MCLEQRSVLKTIMSSVAVLTIFLFFLQGVLATVFPPVGYRPPIPSEAVRTLDISQRYYIQDDLPPNPSQSVLRDEEIYPPEPKIDDQRWYIPENQSGETGDYPSSSEAFERYYSNGSPAVGPVATPLPDDAYVAQQSGTSNILPDGPQNAGAPDIWVLTKRPDNQYAPERWVRIPTQTVVQVANQDAQSTQFVSDTVRSLPFPSPIADTVKSVPLPPPPPPPPPSPPIKSQFQPAPIAPSNVIRQIWIRSPNVADSSKFYQNPANFVDDLSPVRQVVDASQTSVKQVVQPQITKQFPFPPPQQQQISVISKGAPLPLAPPPPPAPAPLPVQVPPPAPVPVKGVDQVLISSGSVAPITDGSGFFVGKDGKMPQMRHIWIPTSQQTGKFISVPMSDNVDIGKSVSVKGAITDGSPIAVSDTWVLKQDGTLPRFEPQKSAFPLVQNPPLSPPNPNVVVGSPPVIQISSPKNQDFGKNVNVPYDIWPVRSDNIDSKVFSKSVPASVFPVASKSDTIVVGKTLPDSGTVIQKSYAPSGKVFIPPPPPPPPALAPAIPLNKDKPCPISPLQYVQPQKSIPTPSFPRVLTAIKRQPFSRIIRVNRYPFGSYYVLTSRLGSNIYAYQRPAAVVRQTKNGAVRLVPSTKVPPPVPARQLTVPLTRQINIPVASKSSNPLVYPGVSALSQLRYAYPWGGYIKSYPIAGKNVFPVGIPPAGSPLPNPAAMKISNSDSSSSESSSSESAPVEPAARRSRKVESRKTESRRAESKKTEPKKPESKKPAKLESSSESNSEEKPVENLEDRKPEESEQEVETSEEAKSSESKESEEDSAPEVESETDFDIAESQISPLVQRAPSFQTEGLNTFIKPYAFGYDQRDSAGTVQHHKQLSDTEGRVIGNYGYKNPNGLYRNVAYIADHNGYRAQVVSNEPSIVNHETANANFVAKKSTEAFTFEGNVPEATEALARETFTADIQRD